MDGYCYSPHWIKQSTLAECSKTVFDKKAPAAKYSTPLTNPELLAKVVSPPPSPTLARDSQCGDTCGGFSGKSARRRFACSDRPV
jgi:hypothetical protein